MGKQSHIHCYILKLASHIPTGLFKLTSATNSILSMYCIMEHVIRIPYTCHNFFFVIFFTLVCLKVPSGSLFFILLPHDPKEAFTSFKKLYHQLARLEFFPSFFHT